LFIVTAVLAIGLTLTQFVGGCMALFIMACCGIGAGWFAVSRTERRQALELEREREKFLGTLRPSAAGQLPEGQETAPATPPWQNEFKFAFSLKQLLIVMTASAVLLTILKLIDVKALTMTLGALALVGLAVQTFGLFDPPPAVVWAWWVLIMMYLGLGLLTAFFPELMGAFRSLDAPLRAAPAALC
jgi:hypothetical protein